MSVGLRLVAVVAAGHVLCGCGAQQGLVEDGGAAGSGGVLREESAAGENVVLSFERWEFHGRAGVLLTTDHYEVRTTETSEVILARLPAFLERALDHYRGSLAELPEPGGKMRTWIMSTRPEWELISKEMLGRSAEPFMRIRRGGYAWGGNAFLFDVGTFDTMAIAAHEGWHQYTQRTFKERLPVCFEEGIAGYMEGHVWGGRGGGTVIFSPWANVERFDQLRDAVTGPPTRNGGVEDGLMPLQTLLGSTPAGMIAHGSGPTLAYYAQSWALIHFLREGAGGKYREGLRALLEDAASGRVSRRVSVKHGGRAGDAYRLRGSAVVVFQTYFTEDLDQADREYRAFVRRVVAPGSRGAIVMGRSPVEPAGGSR